MTPPKPSEDAIRRRAHEIWQRRGAGPGTPTDDWLQAERELAAEPKRVPPAPKTAAPSSPPPPPPPAPLKPLAVAPSAAPGKKPAKRKKR
jgi:hypothetical protein